MDHSIRPLTPAQNCMDCPRHEVIHDPDPHDWFCDDDVAIVCTAATNMKRNVHSPHPADHSAFRAITVACRPYNKRKEAVRPVWCPIAAAPTQEAGDKGDAA